MSQDELTILGYIVVSVAIRSAGSMLALFVFIAIAYTSVMAEFLESNDDVYLFAVFGCSYLICAKQLHSWKEPAHAGCILMSLYCFFYSFDSWAYGEYETWLWRNHEAITACIHVFIMLLLSKALITLVCSRLYLLWNGHCSSKS